MLIGPSEQKGSKQSEIICVHVYVRKWETSSNKIHSPNSVNFPRVVAWEWRYRTSKVKVNHCVRLSYNQNEVTTHSESYLDFGSITCFIWMCYFGSFTEWLQKLLVLVGLRTRDGWLYNGSRLPCHWCHMIQQILWYFRYQWQIGMRFGACYGWFIVSSLEV